MANLGIGITFTRTLLSGADEAIEQLQFAALR